MTTTLRSKRPGRSRALSRIGPVRGGDQNNAFVGVESVHLDEKLIQRLFAFVVSASESGAALTADGVYFIDEDEAGGVFFPLVKKITNTGGADTHKHLDKIRAADGEKGNSRFAGYGPGQEGLARSRSAHQENALRDAASQFLEFFRIPQEADDLLQFFFGFIDAGHILKGHPFLNIGKHFGPAFSEGHGLVATGLHLTHEKNPENDEDEDGKKGKKMAVPGSPGHILYFYGHIVVTKDFDEFIIIRRGYRLHLRRVVVFPFDLTAFDGHLDDVVGFDLGHKIAEIHICFGNARGLENTPQENDDDSRRDPKDDIFVRFRL